MIGIKCNGRFGAFDQFAVGREPRFASVPPAAISGRNDALRDSP